MTMAALAALALAPAASAADEVVSPDAVVESGSLSAAKGVQVWLRWDGRRYRLAQRVDGRVSDAPVPPFEAVRDQGVDDRGLPGARTLPDLGTDARGRLVAIYARCAGRGGRRDCDLYLYRPGTAGPERRLTYASSSACREGTPSISRGVVALTRGRRTSRCRAGLWVVRPDGRARRLIVPRPGDIVAVAATDIQGRRVVASVEGVSSEAEASEVNTQVALFRTSGGRGRILVSGSDPSNLEADEVGTYVGAARLDGRYAYWVRGCGSESRPGAQDLLRLDLSGSGGGPRAMAPRAEFPNAPAFAVDGDNIFYASPGPEGGIRRASDPPRTFEDPPTGC